MTTAHDADPLAEARGLLAFLAAATSPFHAARLAGELLVRAGFTEVDGSQPWDEVHGGCFMVSGGALLAWRGPAEREPTHPFRILGAHTDSPGLVVKPRPDTGAFGWRQLAVEIYGGVLLNSWLDRDLGLSGRVVLRGGEVRLVKIDRPLLRVPQLAIHLDRDVNDKGLLLDRQQHMTPVWGLGDARPGELAALVAEELDVPVEAVVTWDLRLHDLTPPALLGVDEELIASGRLDNLCSCYAAVRALIAADTTAATPVIALFDHEEVGSESTTGAAGPLLERLLNRLGTARGATATDLARAATRSACLSMDMAHAVHPGYPERHEPGHRPLPNQGPVLKVNANQRYATTAPGAARFIEACERVGVPWQVFVSKNSMPCGSTIGPITATRLGIDTVDVGCAQLSMHSARELMGAHDVSHLVAATSSWLAS